jgi:hypothetical protein
MAIWDCGLQIADFERPMTKVFLCIVGTFESRAVEESKSAIRNSQSAISLNLFVNEYVSNYDLV